MRTKEFYAVRNLISLGVNLDYEQLSICNLGNMIPSRNNLDRKYQVDYDGDFKYSQIYTRLDVAVDKFLGLLRVIKEKDANK